MPICTAAKVIYRSRKPAQSIRPQPLSIDRVPGVNWPLAAPMLRNVLRLARSASSADTPVPRGIPEGKVMSFSLRTTFLFSAINLRGMSPADQSPIAMLELQMHASDREVGKHI